jgi:hypothetical protein
MDGWMDGHLLLTFICLRVTKNIVSLSGLLFIVLVIASQIHEFKPGRRRWISKGYEKQ